MSKHSTDRNILAAFLLNLAFSVFELFGGIFTGSVAILSDSVHDLGDAASIGISYFLEKKSKRSPDDSHTYGYARYSVVGSVITTAVLLAGSAIVIYNSVSRLIRPTPIHYNGMIILAVIGFVVNLAAALFTKDGDSLGQKAVNLHMLEDVGGWAVVLVGSVVMRFTDISVIDPIMSLAVAVFILVGAAKMLGEAVNVFLEKTPVGMNINEISDNIKAIDGVTDVHHIHLWTLDGQKNYATLHIVTDVEAEKIKSEVRRVLSEYGVPHVTIETETTAEQCGEHDCHVDTDEPHRHHHH